MSENRETIAKRIHSLYAPKDNLCSFTDKDWEIAGEIEQLQAENEELWKFINEWDGHEPDCEINDTGSPRTGYCSCRYETVKQALKGDTNG